MQSNGARSHDIRVEVVTSTFVAAGRPERVRDLGRFLENLNNPAISKHIHLEDATVRPLYRAALPLALDATLLVRRDERPDCPHCGAKRLERLMSAPAVGAVSSSLPVNK